MTRSKGRGRRVRDAVPPQAPTATHNPSAQPTPWHQRWWAHVLGVGLGLLAGDQLGQYRSLHRAPGLAARLVADDVELAGYVVGRTADQAVSEVRRNGKLLPDEGQPTPPPKDLPPPPPGLDVSHEVLHLHIRNRSDRQAGITGVRVLRSDRSDISAAERDLRNRMHLPLKLGSWDVQAVPVRLDGPAMREGSFLELRDMDDNVLVLAIRDPGSRADWREFKSP